MLMRIFIYLLLISVVQCLFDSIKFFKRGTTHVAHKSNPKELAHPIPFHQGEPNNDNTVLWRYPPILFFLLGVDSCEASALNPQMILVRGPFFQGWLLRATDHFSKLSFILIIGSFSTSKSKVYNEHYVFCGIHSPSTGALHYESFPSPSSVSIHGSSPSTPLKDHANITWSSTEVGSLQLNGHKGHLHMRIADLELRMDIHSRLKWDPVDIGPEGWLAHTPLLPCHYMVHSTGSACNYSLICPSLHTSGHGFLHIEGNHGTFFPDGWVWTQAIAPENSASLSIVGGRFVIGTFTPINWIIYIRTKKRNYIFRTTDIDNIKYKILPPQGSVQLEAVSFDGKMKAVIRIESCGLDGYGPPVYIPTARGFRNIPGCREIYTAVAKVDVYEMGAKRQWEQVHNLAFPLTALEFGGNFQFVPSMANM